MRRWSEPIGCCGAEARRNIGFYSEKEFDLSRIKALDGEDCYNRVLGRFTGGELSDVDGESGGERPPRSLSR